MNEIGVKLEVENKSGKILFELFQDFMQFPSVWVTGDSHEILYEEDIENIRASKELTTPVDSRARLLNKKILTNEQMKEHAYSSEDYYIINATFSVYFNNDISHTSMKTLGQFLNSDCDVVICFADTTDITVFVKKIDLINMTLVRCKEHNYSNYEILYKGKLPDDYLLN
ncbi:DUF2691 family protein [Oceanobacillus manasiensis]|uniref:DUF2691 family protein n=1 Tax=Oceanobacillus manasiensis TaxID=586413 RepID=UPI0005A654E8|nr:DUF2691 family protein [Oceanobacillus manasiensis]